MNAKHLTLNSQLSTLNKAFTLTELLVVILVLVILLSITAAAVNFTLNEEKIRSAARQVQSYVEGARDRAIYEASVQQGQSNQERVVAVGVRFLLDETTPGTSSSMVFIEKLSIPPNPQETIQLQRLDRDNDGNPDTFNDGDATNDDEIWMIRGVNTNWRNLLNRGLLPRPQQGLARIKIPRENGTWYTVSTELLLDPNHSGVERLLLTTPYRDAANTPPDRVRAYSPGSGPSDYELDLPPVARPNQEPVLLPDGIVIDLNRSRIPNSWRFGGSFRSQMDILFSPRGTVTGNAAQRGLIHFYLAERVDTERLNAQNFSGIPSGAPIFGTPPDTEPVGDRIIVTVFTRTGATSTHPVDPTPGNNQQVAKDPFRFAELGEVAGD